MTIPLYLEIPRDVLWFNGSSINLISSCKQEEERGEGRGKEGREAGREKGREKGGREEGREGESKRGREGGERVPDC